MSERWHEGQERAGAHGQNVHENQVMRGKLDLIPVQTELESGSRTFRKKDQMLSERLFLLLRSGDKKCSPFSLFYPCSFLTILLKERRIEPTL